MKDWKNKWEQFKKNVKEAMSNKKGRAAVGIVCYLLIAAVLLHMMWMYSNGQSGSGEDIQKLEYTEFLKLVEDDAVDTIYYSNSEEWMIVTLWNDESRELSEEDLATYEYPLEDQRLVLYPAYNEFRKDMLEHDVTLSLIPSDNGVAMQVLNTTISIVFPIAILLFMFKYMSGIGAKGVDAKSLIQKSDVKFSDVIGQDEIIDDVKFISSLLKNRELGAEVGAKIPKGLLLQGSPGTGKTLIAKAIAGEADVPFIYVNSSSLIEMFVGVGAKRIRDVFKVAKDNAPCIVFFDEIDSIGVKRDGRSSTTEHDQTINALLQEMDGFSGREGVFIIAATNRADKLDSALVRAGRFDRKINVMPPRDWRVREQLFKFYLGKFKVMDDVDIENLSRQVSGFTGADIAAVCNEASIIAVMHEKGAIDMDCLEEAIDKKVFHGNRSKREQHEEDKRVVAYHEGGHAVAHVLLGEPITRASIQSMNSGVGGVVFGEDTDSQFRTKEYYEHRIMICYAGRVAESLKFESVTQGASSDISQATELLYDYMAHLGYDEEFGPLNLDVLAEHQLMTNSNMFELVQKKSKELYERTEKLIKEHIGLLEKVACGLMESETLTGSELMSLIGEGVENG